MTPCQAQGSLNTEGATPDGANGGLLLVQGVVALLQLVLQQPHLRLPLRFAGSVSCCGM